MHFFTKNLLLRRYALGILLVIKCLFLFAQSSQTREYEIKAAFLFNFTQFVEWPSSSFSEPQSPFVIGVLGEDPFGGYLDQTVSGENLNGHPMVIQRFTSVESIKTCHLLFVNSRTDQLDKILSALKGQTILTVSDANNFAKKGGVIRFLTEDNKIRFQINLEAAKVAHLTISSKLLRLSEVIKPQNN